MNKESRERIKKYKKEVKKRLNCGWSMKRVLSKELDDGISAFVEEKENITEEELYSEYGEPQKVVDALFTKKDYSNLLIKAKKRIIIFSILVFILILISIMAIVIATSLYDAASATVNIGTVTITYN